MEVLTVIAAWTLSSLCNSAISNRFLAGVCPSTNITAAVESQLVPRLASGAHVYFPNSTGYLAGTLRWSAFDAPQIAVVVEVATENDVIETVKFANEYNVPFLAKSGGHGAIASLANVNNGIEIWLNQLDSVDVAKDGKTATFGGGILSKTITDTLWEAGYQTVTGCCDCTSLLGPGLGGGHGFLQGQYGLIADQFVSLRLVTADGNVQTLTAQSNPDLWWAMKGAGHNFGIVTSVTSKIYSIENGGIWSYRGYYFTHDKVEGLYTAINNITNNNHPPVGLINYSFFFRYPAIDPENPIVAFFLLRDGVSAVESNYTQPFDDLEPVFTEGSSGTYKDLPEWTGNANTSPPCQKAGLVNMRFPVNLQTYNIPAQRAVFDLFAKVTEETPQFNNSLFLCEGYSLEGVQAIAEDSTAFPQRAAHLLLAPLIIYLPDPQNPSLDSEAKAFGDQLRQILFKASGQSEMQSYVNYATGDEGLEAWYGYEPWRLQKLQRLKAKYDPHGKFSFYAPIS